MSLTFQSVDAIIKEYFIDTIDFEGEYRNINNQLERLLGYGNDDEVKLLLSEIRLNCPEIFKTNGEFAV